MNIHDADLQQDGPEVVFGLVAPVGTDLELVSRLLFDALASVDYKVGPAIRLSMLLDDVPGFESLKAIAHEDDRYQRRMTAGNSFRSQCRRGDAMALLGVTEILENRLRATGSEKTPGIRRAYILRSLKHPEEVKTLRRIYGPSFVLVAAYSPRENRVRTLSERIADSRFRAHGREFRAPAEAIIQRDEDERKLFGQNVRDVYPMADVFVNAGHPAQLREEMQRFVDLFFGMQFLTPTRAEYGMFHASAAALRSASLQRQVGAVIASENGDIIAVGTNEVPRAGGGQYWCGDEPDRRDYTYGREINDQMQRRMLGEVLDRLKAEKWFCNARAAQATDRLLLDAMKMMQGTRVLATIEFGRCVHAEMAAIVDAARRGVPVSGCTLYSTTFPCHECAKHIVAAGICTVFYIEPYPKSLVPDLYPDSIEVDPPVGDVKQVAFRSFVGIAPRRYLDLFAMERRKEQDGRAVSWKRRNAQPKLGDAPPPFVSLVNEQFELTAFRKILAARAVS